MAEHRAFGDACRTAGVLQKRNVCKAELDVIQLMFGALPERRAQANAPGQRKRRHHLPDSLQHEIGDGTLWPGQQISNLCRYDLLDICVTDYLLERIGKVLQDDDALCAGICELMLELPGRVKRIDIYGHQACAKEPEEDDRVLQQIRQHYRDAFAPDEAKRFLQVAREFHRQLVEVSVAERRSHVGIGGTIREFLK
jgi:hypothetical protein